VTESAARPTPPAGNLYDKYGTRHPVARRLVQAFERSMSELLELAHPVASVLEVGCGEGEVTARLAREYPGARIVGRDRSPEIVAEARARHPGLTFEVQAVEDAGANGERFDLVVACEVLEHVEDPERALAALARVTRHHLFASVPREPLWRVLNLARGRYLSRLGDTPGHLQHWSRAAFVRLLSRHFVVRAQRAPLPWTQVLCEPRR